jgi:cell division protein FtsX
VTSGRVRKAGRVLLGVDLGSSNAVRRPPRSPVLVGAVVLVLVVAVLGVAWATGRFGTRGGKPRPAQVIVGVFLVDRATAAQKVAVESALRASPRAHTVLFVSRREAHERFTHVLSDQPELVAATRPEALPESFDVTLARAGDYPQAVAEFRLLPGVARATHRCVNPSAPIPEGYQPIECPRGTGR